MATLQCDRCGARMGVCGEGLLPLSFRCPPCAHPAFRPERGPLASRQVV